MSPYVVLLRGVNVGGARKIRMAELTSSLRSSGFRDAQTYIQSGNIVLSSEASAEQVAADVGRVIQEDLGLCVSALVIPLAFLRRSLEALPFDGDPSRIQIYFCFGALDGIDVSELKGLEGRTEALALGDRVVYLSVPNGVSGSRIARKLEGLLPTEVTARNLRTAQKLAEMASNL